MNSPTTTNSRYQRVDNGTGIELTRSASSTSIASQKRHSNASLLDGDAQTQINRQRSIRNSIESSKLTAVTAIEATSINDSEDDWHDDHHELSIRETTSVPKSKTRWLPKRASAFTQRLGARLSIIKQRCYPLILHYWVLEIAACVFSLLCLASIIVLLIDITNKPLDEWTWRYTPTATLSFIATLARGSLALVLAQVLNQLKWNHFQDVKPLGHLQMIDAASRGPLGAAQVLLFSKNLMVCMAAILTVLTLLVGPFTQLVLLFPAQMTKDTTQSATVQQLIFWRGGIETLSIPDLTNSTVRTSISRPFAEISASINRGLASEKIPFQVNCPSGNCIWHQPVKTLAICGSCTDVTANVSIDCAHRKKHSKVDTDVPNESNAELTCNYKFPGQSINGGEWNLTARIFNNTIPQSHTSWLSDEWPPVYDQNYINKQTIFEFNGTEFYSVYHTVDAPNIIDMRALQISHMTDAEKKESIEKKTMLRPAKCSECEFYWCEKTIEGLEVKNGSSPSYKSSTKRLGIADYNRYTTPLMHPI